MNVTRALAVRSKSAENTTFALPTKAHVVLDAQRLASLVRVGAAQRIEHTPVALVCYIKRGSM
jgi:hypothetical protein